jgi:hypothetical protein
MSSQVSVDKSIRERLQRLDNRCSEFSPSIESKWTLLEASLSEQRRSRRKIVWIFRAAAFSVVLFFTMFLILLEKLDSQVGSSQINVLQGIRSAEESIPPRVPVKPVKALVLVQKKVRRISDSAMKSAIVPVEEYLLASTPALKHDSTLFVAEKETTRQRAKIRYIQLDFGEVREDKPPAVAPAYAAGWQIRFKPNTSQKSNDKPENSQIITLGLKF